MSKAEENVELVKKGFAAYDAGDLDTVIAMWHPDVLYHGFNAEGERAEYRGRDAFFGMLIQAGALLEENVNEIVSAQPVGDEIVVVQVRGKRRAKGDKETTFIDYVMVLRIENGQVTHGTDMVDSKDEAFWRNVATSVG